MFEDKTMVADTLAGINGELMRFGEMIPQTENKELKTTLKQFRAACEQSQEELYQIAREKSYYVPAAEATQKEIEADLQVSHPTVVGIISRMEQKGFLCTWTDPMDRRNKIVRLTDKAIKLDREIDATVAMQDEMLLRGLSEQQVDELRNCLARIVRNLEQE